MRYCSALSNDASEVVTTKRAQETFGAVVLVMGIFVHIERRRGRRPLPLVPLTSLKRDRLKAPMRGRSE